MALRIVLLDVLKLCGFPERRNIPIQPPQPLMNGRVPRSDIADITLKVLDIDRVKADDRSKEPNIRLGDVVAEVVGGFGARKIRLDLIEGREERSDGLLVGLLGSCEAGLVDAVVDVVVSPFVCGVDLGPEGLREEVDVLVLVCEEVVEFVVEHANDFGAFVADNAVCLFIVEDGDCKAAFVVGFVVEVNVAQVREGAVQWVGGSVGSRDIFVRGCEAPAWLGM